MISKKLICLILICLIGFIDIMGIGLVYPMFASMIYQGDCLLLAGDTSETMKGFCLGILLATMPLTQFFSAPMLGMLSDQKGRRKILIPSLLIGVLGYLLAMVAVSYESFFLLLLSRVGVGISAGTAAVVSASLADLSSPENKAKNFGIFNMACGLGFTAGPFLGGSLSEFDLTLMSGYALPFALAGAITLLNALLVFFYFEETCVTKTDGKVSLILGINNVRKAFSGGGLQLVFLAVFLACVGWSFYWEFTPVTWISSYGFSTSTIGNFYAYGAAVYALSCGVLIRPIVSRYSNQHVLCFALFMVSLSIGILYFHVNEVWLWVYIPLQQFGIALFWPTAAALVSNSAGDDVQGEIMGVFHSLEALAFSISPLIAGPLLGFTAFMPIFLGSALMLFAGGVLVAYLRKPVITDAVS